MRLVFIALGWALGVIVARQGLSPTWPLLVVIAGVAVFINRRNTPFLWLNIALLAFTLGGWRYATLADGGDIRQFNEMGGLTITGQVTDAPDITDNYALLRVDVTSVTQGGSTTPTNGAVIIRAPRNTPATYGDVVRASGLLLTPGSFDAFDYGAYLARQGVYSLLDRASVEVIAQNSGNPFRAMLINLREDAKRHINRILPEPQAGLLIAILTGDRRGLLPQLSTDFRDVGAAHLLAISGFNMVIIAGMVSGFLRAVLPGRKWLSVFIACGVILVYAAFTGGAPPVVRAALMSALYFIAEGFRRRTFTPASIALAVLVISAQNPNALWDVGFQLSLCAVLGLAFLTEPIARGFAYVLGGVFSRSTTLGIVRVLEGPIIVTLAAQIAVTPLLLLTFGQVSTAFLLVNALVIPAHAYVLAFGWLALVIFWVAPLSQILLWVAFALSSWTIGIVRLFADLPFAQISFYVSPLLIGGVYGVALGVAMAESLQPGWWLRLKGFMRQRRTVSTLSVSACGILIVMGLMWNTRPTGRLDVWFLDTGRGHVVLLQTPDGAQMLINGGRSPSRLLNALGERLPINDRTLELVMISTPDGNAQSALLDVFSRYRAGLVLTNGQQNLSSLYEDIIIAAQNAAEVDVSAVSVGYQIQLSDGVLVEVLHPLRTPGITDSLPDSALVVRIRYGDVSFLLMSDASPDAQTAMLNAGLDLRADVLQLPAHGGRNTLNAAFLQAVAPSAVIIQADRSREDEPHTGTLALLPTDVIVFRTDADGTQHLWTDGTRLFTTAR